MKQLLFLSVAAVLVLTVGVLAADKNPVVVMETSKGTIKVELLPDKAPITVKNFLSYVEDKFYDGTIYHRVVPNPAVIQGGGYEAGQGRQKKTKDQIKNEASNGLSNTRGTIAMARTAIPDSATSQFYINFSDNTYLDKDKDPQGVGYCVFGKVIDGMDVVDEISKVRVGRGGKPLEDVVIKSVRVAEK
jgi:cyclophilin family peptidyl-prolyl cis-trans isomerase